MRQILAGMEEMLCKFQLDSGNISTDASLLQEEKASIVA